MRFQSSENTHDAKTNRAMELPVPDYSSHYRQLVESLPAAVYTCDKLGYITFYNEAAEILWGRKPEIGKDLWCGSWKIYHPDGSPMELGECPMAITLKKGIPVMGEEIIVERPDGVRRNIQPHPKPIFDASGNLDGAVNMLVDVTEKKNAQHEIRESEKKYRMLAKSLEKEVNERTFSLEKRNEELKRSEDRYHKMIEEVEDYAIILLDKNGTIMNWNKGAEKIKGYKEEEIIGKNFRTFYLPEDRKNMLPEKLLNEAVTKGKAMHEGWRVRKDGSTFWGSIVITVLHDDEKNIIGFSKVTRDLTERKIAEDKMKQYNVELEFQNKELEQFAYVASHDLQEPLRKIQTFSDLLGKNLDDPKATKKSLEKINSSAKRMNTLIKDILNYSRLSKTADLFKEVDLNEVLRNVKSEFEVVISQKKAVINSSELPVLHCIPVQLHQLFLNFIGNSIKFNDNIPVIDISSEKIVNSGVNKYPRLNKDYSYIKIIFKDNGIGFDPQYGQQIFKLFQRLNDSTLYEGTGIGLTICKKIVENHHGFIEVASQPGKGTTITVFFPQEIAP